MIDNERRWRSVGFSTLLADMQYIHRFGSVDGRCDIAFFQDPRREVRYYHLSGSDLDAHEVIIRERVPTFTRAEIDALMVSATTTAEKVVAVYHAAAAATPRLDPTILDFLTRSSAEADPAVRRAAVDATLLAGYWPALLPLLERVGATDPTPDLRTFAAETLQRLRTELLEAPPPEEFRFFPLPADVRWITPLTGVGDDWYEAAHGCRP